MSNNINQEELAENLKKVLGDQGDAVEPKTSRLSLRGLRNSFRMSGRLSLRGMSFGGSEANMAQKEADKQVRLDFETMVMVNTSHLAIHAAELLQQFASLPRQVAGWEGSECKQFWDRRALGGSSGFRGVKTIRATIKVQKFSAPELHHHLQTEAGLTLVDKRNEIFQMGFPLLGPQDLLGRAGTAHVEHVDTLGTKGKEKNMLMMVCNDETNYVTTFSSVLMSEVPGGSVYQSFHEVSLSNPRSVIATELRCTPVDEHSCYFTATHFMDLCGFTTPSTNNKANRVFMKLMLQRVGRYGQGLSPDEPTWE